MPALIRDLTVEQGSTWSRGFVPTIDGEPFLNDDWTARAQVRRHPRSEEVLYEWSAALGNVGIDPDNGAVFLYLIPADSAEWTWRLGCYDLEVSNPDNGVTHRIVRGRILVDAEVTRDV